MSYPTRTSAAQVAESTEGQAAPLPAILPNGEASAAILAAGIGSAIYGLIVLIAESNPSVAQSLILNSSVGPLSGKSTFGVLAWLLAWGGLHFTWRSKHVNFERMFTTTVVLLVAALLFTFPPFFELFVKD